MAALASSPSFWNTESWWRRLIEDCLNHNKVNTQVKFTEDITRLHNRDEILVFLYFAIFQMFVKPLKVKLKVYNVGTYWLYYFKCFVVVHKGKVIKTLSSSCQYLWTWPESTKIRRTIKFKFTSREKTEPENMPMSRVIIDSVFSCLLWISLEHCWPCCA